ncbi:penicillin-binding protein 2 [candidate division WWE3 bacterium CG08_land_8_20_14_0_20_43_13]|uniref:Penicillin-binding protein 2 n=1 Tax=candidate division WWE3 bacterium CG08_land_8_20_14_0_20_43_13 TaxID=1975087 RepID=A0A2H0X6X6_UNCKA|nr:MAG: penicillin-binding protein 2 [candidate division WWE3 bacterium CG08_land_8_20_14_0_20_43_13]
MKKSSRAKIFFDSVLRGPSLFSYLKNQSRRRGVFWLDYFCPPILSETVLPEWLFSFKRVGLCVVFLLFIIFSGRLIYLQAFLGKYYSELASQNRLRQSLVRAERGVIYDQHGQSLVENKAGFRVSVELPKLEENEDCKEAWEELGKILSLEPLWISQRIARAQEQLMKKVVLASSISHDTVLLIEEELWHWPMVTIEIDPVRSYLLGESSAHVLGYLGEISSQELEKKKWFYYDMGDWVGKLGLESFYDQYLHGLNGSRIYETMSNGLGVAELSIDLGRSGLSLMTNLDANLQKAAYDYLKEQVSLSSAFGGAVVAQDTRTGAVLALVSYPSFDPNLLSRSLDASSYKELISIPNHPFFNRAVEGLYPPGSIFKLVTGSGILEEGIASPDDLINDEGGISVGIYHYGDWKPEGHGRVSFVKALAQSCDTYFYIFGGGYKEHFGLGVDGIFAWAKYYGYGDYSGIDLPGESAGLVPNAEWKQENIKEKWYLGDTYHYAIGQGYLLAAPLQVNNATVAVANGGTLFEPWLAKAILYSPGEIKEEFYPRILRQNFVSAETLSYVKEGMRQAVLEGGTAYPLRDFSIACGAKTGTAEFGDPAGRTHAWFTAFCPFENPEIAVTVLLEAGGEGSSQAGPVVRKVMEEYFSNRLDF